MSTLWATASDYATYIQGPPPANATALLRSAMLRIRKHISNVWFDADDAGLPTDTAKRQAVKDAICAQVQTWIAAGVDPAAGGLSTGIISSKSLDGASISYDNSLNASVTAFEKRQSLIEDLCPDAEQLLAAENMLSTRVRTFG